MSALAAGVVLAMVMTVGCPSDDDQKPAVAAKHTETAKPVTVADVTAKNMPVDLTAVGTVEAYATVAVKSQVEGVLTEVHLREGQCVQTGDLLFAIDSQPFSVQLKQMQANLARDRAQLDNARMVLQRNASVVTKGYVSQEQYDKAAANAAALTATVQADAAAVEHAQIELAYCTIRSPLSGCAGEILLDRGNVVKANDTDHPLVVIRQIDPIYVGFSVPERYLPDIKKHSQANPLVVVATPAGREKSSITGELSFVDNTVNSATGTILLKATFANARQSLWPGQFVSVTLQLDTQPDAVVVPSQAVQTGQEGQYVYVLQSNQTVVYRPVTVNRTVSGEAVVSTGLQPGERVVTDGQLRLFPGAPVKIVAGIESPAGEQRP